jgi:hypothetical protein
MDKLLATSDSIVREIRQIISSSSKLDVAVSFWGRGALSALGLPSVGAVKRTRVICNLESGATNPAEIQELRNLGVDVRTHPTLHAKMWLGERALIVGSANASANGLGLEGTELTRWVELCHLTDSSELRRTAGDWFSQTWEQSHKIDDSMIEEARIRWKLRRANRFATNGRATTSLIGAARASVEQFRDLPLFVVLDDEEIGKAAKAVERRFQREHSRKFEAWQDWPRMPKAATLLAWYSDGGRLSHDGVYSTPDKKQRSAMTVPVGKTASKLYFATKIAAPKDFSLGDKAAWKLAIQAEVSSRRRGSTSWIMPFFDFATRHFHR